VAAAESTAARESATDVPAAKAAAAKMATAAAEPAATTMTAAAAATTSSEGVSPDRRHTEGDHRKHDTNFAQHGILHYRRDGVRFCCRYRHTAQCEFGPDYKGM
jgi:guanyl-specific ribonuclease Sa